MSILQDILIGFGSALGALLALIIVLALADYRPRHRIGGRGP